MSYCQRVVVWPRPTDHLNAQEVLASLDTVGDLEGDLALVGDHAVDTPHLAAVHAIFPDLIHGQSALSVPTMQHLDKP